MVTLRQIKNDIPVINRLHLRFGKVNLQHNPTQEELQATVAYVKKNTVAAHEGRKCVDGRYPPDTAQGMLARAGGDCGYVMALMAINHKKKLKLTPEQCFNAVYKVINQKMHGAFCIHTDHHADPEQRSGNHLHQTLIGCGHLSKASQWQLRQPYDVQSSDVKKVIAYAKNLAAISDTVEMVNLNGEHSERGVLIIDDSTHTVNAMEPKEHMMYFIYDKKRDEAFMKQLVREMEIPEVTFEDMKMEADIQLQATLHNIAKGLPIYTVSYKNKQPQVTYLTTIH
ncbi:MAG TPA: hypothetical protein VNW29_01225 [Candidatus Sulfotelmatobacter sp.]|jgi:hypothetical protein|nr:hypothetical protein [Candidatus Sulfotelmatobacter sp.]